MTACSAILKSIDLLILRPEDKVRLPFSNPIHPTVTIWGAVWSLSTTCCFSPILAQSLFRQQLQPQVFLYLLELNASPVHRSWQGALMPHLGKLVRQFDYLIGMEMSDQLLGG